MYHCFDMTSFILVVPEKSVHDDVEMAKNQIRKPEIHAKKSHCYGHHNRGGPHILPRRPIDLSHLHPHIVQEASHRFRYTLTFPAGSISENPLTRCSCSSRFVFAASAISLPVSPAVSAAKTGRGGGIRTPTLGFGDRWSTVEPTPLNFRTFGSKIHPEPAVQGEG